MSYETISVKREGRTFRITLNRPEVLNAFNALMLQEVVIALDEAMADDGVGVVCVDSASDRAFSAGIDVAYVKDMPGTSVREIGRELHRTFLALRTVEKPVVCEIDGLCLGAGLEFALSCDFMIGSDKSTYGLPNIHRGIPAIVEAAILPIAIGIQGTRELCYLGENWDAEKAERRGMIQSYHPSVDLKEKVKEVCDKISAKSSVALGTQKEIIHKWMTTDMESAIDFSINTVVVNWMSKDQKEGMGSFLEKRKAKFKGE